MTSAVGDEGLVVTIVGVAAVMGKGNTSRAVVAKARAVAGVAEGRGVTVAFVNGKGNTRRAEVAEACVITGVEEGRVVAAFTGRVTVPAIGMGGNGVSVGSGPVLRVRTTYWLSACFTSCVASTIPFAASTRTLSQYVP